MSSSDLKNASLAEDIIPSFDSDQERPSNSSGSMESRWPDEIELLKRIRRSDGEDVQDESQFLGINVGTRNTSSGLAEQDSTTEYVLSLETYGQTEELGRRRGLNVESFDWERGQMKRLTILSNHLRRVFQEVVDFYPAVDLTQAPLVFYSPYSFLFHFLPSLEGLSKKIDDRDCRYTDLRVLLLLCDRHLSKPFGLLRSTLDSGRISFFALEILFRPGVKLLARDHLCQWQVFMCVEAKQEPKGMTRTIRSGDDEMAVTAYRVAAWHLAWNPVLNKFERQMIRFRVANFDGSRAINTLSVFPLDFFGDEPSRDALIESLVQRGHRWHQLASRKPTCWLHEGASLVTPGRLYDGGYETVEPKHHVGRVIVDSTASIDYSWVFSVNPWRSTGGATFWDNRPEFFSYDDLPPEGDFVDEQALFCPASISCFEVVNQVQLVLAISHLRPVQWNKAALDQLLLHQDKKERISSLIQNYAEKTVKDLTNTIAGKGAGLVFVLYGPPGVGKTLTAESVAEFHEMPLISVRLTDLVGGYDGSKSSVWWIIDKADELGAILLLDEADVILESRSYEDVRRNTFVSKFLRTVEYFNGILFMTTNRLETMDVAFRSRIQMAIEYKSFSKATRRKIWSNIINRVKDEESREELLEELDYLKGLDLNGREIQNVVKMAQSMALGISHSSSGKIKGTVERKQACLNISHIKKAADEALSFQKYFKDQKEVSRSHLQVNIQGKRKGQRNNHESDDESDDE
ncbi:hypothetical protein EPUS_06682 [Endocarpon pusillum Z07020]|uniref:AAA+ ATPase domain-containing protein n=1 Tax=Endocarpon pusillum (strain Z07020 / HMAS-L-300199) TaxID=1263415 RepID=U1HFU4_ENDPU|nr:uncharacterized protein EPUS_06682 [Endocarpon pusillum Z07020]ERF68995.1 hypothetical protein EPUS_06682 [Endocarpon pusillum Z07020]